MSEEPVYLAAAPERSLAPFEADERETLTSFLDFQRATLAVECAGLTADQLRGATVPQRPRRPHPRAHRRRNRPVAGGWRNRP